MFTLRLELNEYGLEFDFFNNGVYLNWITLGIIAIATIAIVVYKNNSYF